MASDRSLTHVDVYVVVQQYLVDNTEPVKKTFDEAKSSLKTSSFILVCVL